jgi:asparagine synthase (glutamine-hydrolysing)
MVHQLLSDAVRKRLSHSERPVGLLCSGGVDSALITSIASRAVDPALITVFTMEYAGSRSEDAFYARLLCSKLGFRHTVVSFSRDDVAEYMDRVIVAIETYDPNTIRAAIPMYLLAKHIAENTDIKVILSGEGADELFAGYSYFRFAPDGSALNAETARLVRNTHMFDLLRADRCFAAFGLEVRVPYLDRYLVDYVLQVDGRLKMFGPGHIRQAEKALLRTSFLGFEELSMLRILDRPKERFSDGCGFSYVPQLLAKLGGAAPDLETREQLEKAHYRAVFRAAYGSNWNWIIERSMPAWVRSQQAAVKQHKLLDS